MKSVRLVQIFCPIKETNRTHSRPLCGGFVDTERAKKMCQDDGVEFISASLMRTQAVTESQLYDAMGFPPNWAKIGRYRKLR